MVSSVVEATYHDPDVSGQLGNKLGEANTMGLEGATNVGEVSCLDTTFKGSLVANFAGDQGLNNDTEWPGQS